MSIKEIKLGEAKGEEKATSGFIAVGTCEGRADWDCVESDGLQPTIEEAIAAARRYDWDTPFFIAEVNVVAKVVE